MLYLTVNHKKQIKTGEVTDISLKFVTQNQSNMSRVVSTFVQFPRNKKKNQEINHKKLL